MSNISTQVSVIIFCTLSIVTPAFQTIPEISKNLSATRIGESEKFSNQWCWFEMDEND